MTSRSPTLKRQSARLAQSGISARFALTLLQEVVAICHNVDALLKRLGMPFTRADLRAGRVAQLTDVQFVRLHAECITALSVQANRERGLPPMSKDEVDMLCYCVITCETLAEVIERAQRFCAMLDHRAADLSLDTTGTQAIFHMATQRLKHSASGLLTDLNGLSFYHRLFAWLIGTPIPVRGYEVYAEPMVDAATLEGFYGQSIRFGCEDNRFAFPARLLAKPVVRSYSSLLERLRVCPFEQVAPGLDGRLADAVKRILANRVAQGAEQPSMEQFAGLFNLSRATFQRRLRAEGAGLEQIRREVLLELSRELLRDGANLKLADIAQRLGFSDARAFRRAFIVWTGEGPDAWRRGEQRR